MIRFLIYSVVAYYVFHYIIVPMIGKPKGEHKSPHRYQEDDSIKQYKTDHKTKKNPPSDDDYAEYEEIK
jgi:hypothetical protein